MKHPSKKYALNIPLTDANRQGYMDKMQSVHAITEKPDVQPNQVILAHWKGEDGTEELHRYIQITDSSGERYQMPAISLVVLYFDTAYFNWRGLQKSRSELIPLLDKPNSHDTLQKVYFYYGRAVSCILSLFASIEALISSYVQENTQYERKVGRQILSLKMEEKMTKVIMKLSKRNFGASYGKQWEQIRLLKSLRDEITHPKSLKDRQLFDHLVDRIFLFDLDASMEAVKAYLNFYARNDSHRIEDCQCGKDW